MTEFTVVIEKDESNLYTAEVVELPGCFTQGATQDQLLERIKEAIELYLETIGKKRPSTQFIGIQKVVV